MSLAPEVVMLTHNCARCLYWACAAKVIALESIGECRRRPPVPTVIEVDPKTKKPILVYPVYKAFGSCDEYRFGR